MSRSFPISNPLFPGIKSLSLPVGTLLSAAIHGLFFLVLWALFLAHRQEIVAELQLNPVVTQPPIKWTLARKGHQVVVQKVVPEKVEPEPVVAKPVWVPASQTARQPRWVGNLIDPDDYPSVARQAGSDGRVLLLLHIDTDGKVQDVQLLKGSYEVLNEFAVHKVREGIFTPAYDKDGIPVPCEVTLPILFQLE